MKMTGNTRFLNWFEEGLRYTEGKLGNTYPNLPLGKLGLKDEPAGKVRVFAMVDCITQWIFRPLHDRIFEILKLIPQDGTFDQERPLTHLSELGVRGVKLNSFDLSAATDRLPVKIQATLLSSLLGAHAANIWMVLLTSREYTLPQRASESSGLARVHYAVGQPMGALTSWAMLALTHHCIVQWAASRAGVIRPGEWFSDYAVLGDDIVLANERVSSEYLLILEELGVQVGLAKSLESTRGALEFAKRFIVGPVNLSPTPLAEVVAGCRNLSAAIELSRKYGLSKEALAGVLGFGYKVRGSMNGALRCLGKRARTLVLAWMAPTPGSGRIREFLSYTGEKPRDITESSIQSYRDAFAKRMLDRLESLRPQLEVIRTLVTVDRTRAHYGTIEFPPESTDFFLQQFVSINKPPKGKKGPRTYLSNFFFRQELGPICSSRDMAVAEMRNHINPQERRFIHSLFEYVYREPYLDVLSDIAKLRTTLEDTTDFSIENLENIVATLDSIESDLASVALFPRTSERVSGSPNFSMAPNRFVKMWKSFAS
jgi:hypothetical protein